MRKICWRKKCEDEGNSGAIAARFVGGGGGWRLKIVFALPSCFAMVNCENPALHQSLSL